MICINTQNTESAKQKHYKELAKKVISRLNDKDVKKHPEFESFVKEHLEEILIGVPSKLIELQKSEAKAKAEFLKKCPNIENLKKSSKETESSTKKKKAKNKDRWRALCESVFDYKSFTSKKKEYDAYDLAANLKINCCPNCNRLYTITVSEEVELTRPEFDHYFPKAKYPLLALSFYNLIPSCHICNSTIKGEKDLRIEEHLHPYLDNVLEYYKFGYELKDISTCSKIKIDIDECDQKERIRNTMAFYKIEEIYTAHSHIVDDILRLKRELSDDYLEILTTFTKDTKMKLSPQEAYRLAFGVPYEDEELINHPFSKLKKDILQREEMLSIFDIDAKNKKTF